MTLPYEFGADQDVDFEPNIAESDYPAVVPVKIVMSETENVPPQFASCMTWPIGQVGVASPTQILQRRLHRFKTQFLLNMPGAGVVTFNTKQEPLMNPNPQGFSFTAAAIVANQALPPFESAQPLYVIASIAGCTVAVLDQSYGQTQ